jgi:hypothetical protein
LCSRGTRARQVRAIRLLRDRVTQRLHSRRRVTQLHRHRVTQRRRSRPRVIQLLPPRVTRVLQADSAADHLQVAGIGVDHLQVADPTVRRAVVDLMVAERPTVAAAPTVVAHRMVATTNFSPSSLSYAASW